MNRYFDRYERRHCLAVVTLLLTAGLAGAVLDAPLLDSRAPLEADADRLDYDRANGRLVANGNAVVRQGGDELRADRIVMDTRSGVAIAAGNVVLTRPTGTVRADRLEYDFHRGTADIDSADIETAPYIVKAEAAGRLADNRYAMRDAQITTCELDHDHWHYHIRARRIEISPGDYFKARHATWYLGQVPVFYLPYWNRNLDADRGFHLRPGFSSRWGAYLLTAYRHPVNEQLRLEHQVDTRSERGLAIGELIRWRHDGHRGDLHLYFLNDIDPTIGKSTQQDDLDAERYRIQLRHRTDHGPRTYSLLQAETASDAFLRPDFFERDFRSSPQPANVYALTHRGDRYTLTGLMRYRFDPFYDHINRLPELAADVMRLQIGNSSLYYESRSSAAWLERAHARPTDREDYSTLRADTEHIIYQPRQFFGWLNVMPRAGYRGTYYSDTVADGGDTFRSIFFGGAEASYKAYRVLSEDGSGIRHMAEPYLNYTYVRDPDVLPEELLQFDPIDTLRGAHVTRTGMRNKLQTRRDGDVFDLLDLNLYTDVLMEPANRQRRIENLFFELETQPARALRLQIDGQYNIEARTVDRLNSRLYVCHDPTLDLFLEHRFVDNAVDLLTAVTTVRPGPRWAFNAFGRYSFESSRTEEQGFYVQRNLDCMAVRTGVSMIPSFTRTDGTRRDDEYRFLIEIWLTAFPEQAFTGRSSYYAGEPAF